MLDEIFSISLFNVVSDNDYYYFFRALNNRDNNDILNNVICDDTGVHTILTDRSHYQGESKYSEDSIISLEEVYDHIKYNHRIDTNCISLTSNASVALLYGREFYNDNYIIVRVPKKNLGSETVIAGLYMLEEVNKLISKLQLDDNIVQCLDMIEKCGTQQELDTIVASFIEERHEENNYQKGIKYIKPVETSNYSSLSAKQNFEKNKIVAKINVLNKQLLPNMSNRLLVQTIGLAFSSLELIHYNQINSEEIINCSSYIMDIISILQQIDNPLSKELILLVINNISLLNTYNFKYNNYDIGQIDIDELYNLTNGGIEFLELKNSINSLYYLAKSKLRCISIIKTLRLLTNEDIRFEPLFNEIINKCYGIEYQVISKGNGNQIKLCESIGIDLSIDNISILKYITNFNEEQLVHILEDKFESLKEYIVKTNIKQKPISKERWFSLALIELYNWKRLNISDISPKQKLELSNKLIENNFLDIYYKLKDKGISNSDIANVLLTCIVKKKDIDIDNINIRETFTISEIENFLGYYKIIGTEIVLRDYQASTVKNIDKIHRKYKFCGAILPTGGGKSFVALTEMLKYRDKNILYVAPNDVILSQIEDYIVEYIRGKQGTFGNFVGIKDRRRIIKEVFPNLRLVTYQKINIDKRERERKYDLIVLDEIHRTGAPEWIKSITELLDNQPAYTKVLGLTATPKRDCDGIDMMNYWAKHFGFTKTEVIRHKHLAINMDIYEAIKLGYVVNPKVVSCAYDLIHENGEMFNLLEQIKSLKNEEKQKELLEKYKELRKKVEEADGVKQILVKYLKVGKKYIVFCPVYNSSGNNIEDEDGNIIDSRITGEDVIKKYTELLEEYLGKDNIECYSMLGSYSNSKNRRQRELFEMGDSDKISFLIVMDKANEGMHIANDGLIWFRSLDDESVILCSQQFGRIVYSIEPGQEIKEDDLPLAIDLTNNLLRVKLNRDKLGTRVDDLDKIKLVYDWIEEYGIFPNINSDNKVESRYASILKHIQKKYRKYLNKELLDKVSDEDLEYISEILEIGNSIDLWNVIIPKKEKKITSSKESGEIFALSDLLRDFYELKLEVNANMEKLTFEQKVEELYEEYLRLGHFIKSNSIKRFSDGILMVSWLSNSNHKELIVEYSKENEHARILVEAGHLDKTPLECKIQLFMTRIIYLYDNYVTKKRELPNSQSLELFPDGVKIQGWLKRDCNKLFFKYLIDHKYDYVQEVYDYVGWDLQLSSDDILKLRLEEVYEQYIIPGKPLPTKTSNISFIDGGIIYQFLRRNKDKIYALAEQGNICAKAIIERKFFYSVEEKVNELFEERINYLYENYVLKGKPLPRRNDSDVFPGTTTSIGNWIKEYNKKIKRLINSSDIRFKAFKDYFEQSVIRKRTEEEFLEELKYFCEQLQLGRSVEEIREGIFPNGKKIFNWFYDRKNDIFEYAKKGNEHALYIKRKLSVSSFEYRIKYLYDNYLMKNKFIIYGANECFEDGVNISGWLYRKNTKEMIRKKALEGDEVALLLAKKLNIELEKVKISEKELKRIDYLVETFIDKGLPLPSTSNPAKFPLSNQDISDWINREKEIIKYLASQGNINAQKIVDYCSWEKDKYLETIKCRIEYIYEHYVKLNKELPISSSDDKFEDADALIGIWLRMPKVKDAIKRLVQEGNEIAKKVYKAMEWDIYLTKEEQFLYRIQYLYDNYILKNIDLPIIGVKDTRERFHDGILISYWIKTFKEKIIELSKTNECAKAICDFYRFDLTPEEKMKEQTMQTLKLRVKYLYDTYIATKKGLPKHDSMDSFDDGTVIYKWLNRIPNKKLIEELALNGDDYAMSIMELTTWGKKIIKSISVTNESALRRALENGWILEKDAMSFPSYEEMKKKKIKK